jgi:hypothetical protein
MTEEWFLGDKHPTWTTGSAGARAVQGECASLARQAGRCFAFRVGPCTQQNGVCVCMCGTNLIWYQLDMQAVTQAAATRSVTSVHNCCEPGPPTRTDNNNMMYQVP